MTGDNRLAKVEILIQQKKYAAAESVLTDLLQQESDNITFLMLLAEVNLQQDQLDKATNIINHTIGLSPDEPHLFYIKSRIAIQQDNFAAAEKYINEALALDPYNADYFAMLAHIKLGRKQFEDALLTADKALEIDAENLLALNARSTALNKLNRKDESFETIEGALREDPENAYTHANYGWGLLEKGQHKKALEHFKEALTSDPSLEYAQSGMLESIKASNPLYRLFLKYSFWMGNLTARYQWVVIIGFYLGSRLLSSLADNSEALRPYLTPLIFALAIVAFSTWIFTPISNLFLRFNMYGKLLLDKRQKMSSNFVAVSFLTFVAGLVLYFLLADERMLSVAVFGFAMMLPLGTIFAPARNKYGLLVYTAALAVVGILAIKATFSTGHIYNTMSNIFIFGFIVFQWTANFMLIRENNR